MDLSNLPWALSYKITERGSCIRGEILTATRNHVPLTYGFSDSSKTKVIKKNKELYDLLVNDNAYMFKVWL